jgi:hypothetical protein
MSVRDTGSVMEGSKITCFGGDQNSTKEGGKEKEKEEEKKQGKKRGETRMNLGFLNVDWGE